MEFWELSCFMPLTYDQFNTTRHFSGLNGLRCIAIIMVIWHHSAGSGFIPGLFRGYLGVDLFFILSGFLITTLLIRERKNTGKISLKQFWARRFLRLMPAYYGSLLFLALAYVILKPGDNDTATLIKGLPIYALYLSNWFQPGANNLGPLWSLATEEQFYLIWPLFESFLTPILLVATWILLFFINQLVNFGLLDSTITTQFGISTSEHPEILETTFTPILLGVALAHFLSRNNSFDVIKRITAFRASPLIYGVLILLVINIPANEISGLFRLTLHILMTLWISAIVINPASRTTVFLDNKAIAFIGIISYGMYLYHMWAIYALRIVLEKIGLHQPILLFFTATGATIAGAAISYHFFEKYFLNLRDRFRPK